MKPALAKLIEQSLEIAAVDAVDADELGFMARCMVQATLPHKRTEGAVFERKNGNFSLTLMAHPSVGLPFGSTPRLLLSWLTTEAVRTKSRELELGDTLSGFMAELGMVPTGGRWGSIGRLKTQTERLFASSVSAVYKDAEKTAIVNRSIADKAVLWWDPKRPDQGSLWKSSVKLSEPFFDEILDRPVPVDMRALQALKRSPLALDTYMWLTYRSSYTKRPTLVPWASLELQFGSEYGDTRFFKAALLDALRKVLVVYPGARVDVLPEGLQIKPGPTAVRKLRG